jgi:tRNA (guanine37-N1)-methyltransferase
MIFTILTLFPDIFTSPLQESIIKKATDRGLISFHIINIRDFAEDIHRTCDDSPYGGGPGMVMKIEPVCRAIEHVKDRFGKPQLILLTPQGRPFDQKIAVQLAKLPHIGLVCGRYEGVDERVLSLVDDEISIGDYILSGGELPALVLVESITRCIPGVLGNDQSAINETFEEYLLEYPQYTRPPAFMDAEVPPVLLSGNHEEIRRWRRREAIRKTIFKRPDLMDRFVPTDEDRKFIKEILGAIPE